MFGFSPRKMLMFRENFPGQTGQHTDRDFQTRDSLPFPDSLTEQIRRA